MDRCPYCNADLSDPYRTPPLFQEDKPKEEKPKRIWFKGIKDWYANMNWDWFFKRLWDYTVNIFWSLVVISLVSVAIFSGYKFASTPNKIDYCFIAPHEQVSNSWTLMGHVPWNLNRTMGSFSSPDEAQKYAIKINCPLDLTPKPETLTVKDPVVPVASTSVSIPVASASATVPIASASASASAVPITVSTPVKGTK